MIGTSTVPFKASDIKASPLAVHRQLEKDARAARRGGVKVSMKSARRLIKRAGQIGLAPSDCFA
jgi:hypothetical protein